jgi:hypothetical protein
LAALHVEPFQQFTRPIQPAPTGEKRAETTREDPEGVSRPTSYEMPAPSEAQQTSVQRAM